MKTTIFTIICTLMLGCASTKRCPKAVWIAVTATMYNATASQTDKTPTITADGTIINPRHPGRHVAVSRDLLKPNGPFTYGDSLEVDNGQKSGLYRISDTMSSRWKNRIDFLEPVGARQYKINGLKIRKGCSC